jgi:Tfp pilus assembly protein PilP
MNRYLLIATLLWLSLSTHLCMAGSPDPFPSPKPRRNLFKPVETTPTPLPLTALPPLQRYPLSALTLTAIITNALGQRYASVENPEGIGYKVVRGTMIGAEGARVIDISLRGMIVEEPSVDGARSREILLRKER